MRSLKFYLLLSFLLILVLSCKSLAWGPYVHAEIAKDIAYAICLDSFLELDEYNKQHDPPRAVKYFVLGAVMADMDHCRGYPFDPSSNKSSDSIVFARELVKEAAKYPWERGLIAFAWGWYAHIYMDEVNNWNVIYDAFASGTNEIEGIVNARKKFNDYIVPFDIGNWNPKEGIFGYQFNYRDDKPMIKLSVDFNLFCRNRYKYDGNKLPPGYWWNPARIASMLPPLIYDKGEEKIFGKVLRESFKKAYPDAPTYSAWDFYEQARSYAIMLAQLDTVFMEKSGEGILSPDEKILAFLYDIILEPILEGLIKKDLPSTLIEYFERIKPELKQIKRYFSDSVEEFQSCYDQIMFSQIYATYKMLQHWKTVGPGTPFSVWLIEKALPPAPSLEVTWLDKAKRHLYVPIPTIARGYAKYSDIGAGVALFYERDGQTYILSGNKGAEICNALKNYSDKKLLAVLGYKKEDAVTTLGISFEVKDYIWLDEISLSLTTSSTTKMLSFNAEGENNQTTFSFNLGGSAEVSIRIFDNNFKLARTISSGEELGSGIHSLIWNGKDDSDKDLPDGSYSYSLIAQSSDGYKEAFPITGNLLVDRVPPTLEVMEKVDNIWFSPKLKDFNLPFGFRTNEYGKVRFTLNFENTKRANYDIPVFANEGTKLLWKGQTLEVISNSSHSFIEIKDTIDDGIYNYEICALDKVENRSSVVKGVVNIDSIPPILNLSLNRKAISPNGDGVKDSLKINYSISDNLSPTAEVKLYLWRNGHILGVLVDENKTLQERTETSPTPTFGFEENLDWDGIRKVELANAVIS